ncbi:hypothetical protein B0J12DRAFT_705922 [Macrophomina phaseolina]|uniref:Uncharacterized protein n=1 Tax=Macrophomina phaseolina TaxID=35725 RepID=A0ABQ8FQN1_9PEZI|nr:hypothetical protein B0J12DRAFT_705922 [Macrophomina phaseolina]
MRYLIYILITLCLNTSSIFGMPSTQPDTLLVKGGSENNLEESAAILLSRDTPSNLVDGQDQNEVENSLSKRQTHFSAPIFPTQGNDFGNRYWLITIHGIGCKVYAYMPDIHTIVLKMVNPFPGGVEAPLAGLTDATTGATVALTQWVYNKVYTFKPQNHPIQFDNTWRFYWN